MKKRILLVEDDVDISDMLKLCLSNEGYDVDTAYDGEEGIKMFEKAKYSLVILDLMMPKVDGMGVLKVIRDVSQLPVLILSAKGTDVDKAIGLGLGADDYIAKPFSMIEIVARVRAAIRRATVYGKLEVESKIIIGELEIDVPNYLVKKNDKLLKLTQKEFQILKLFAENPKRVFTKAQVFSSVWDDDYFGDENVINVHMRRLREKIEDNPSKPTYILTLWGIGYKLGDL